MSDNTRMVAGSKEYPQGGGTEAFELIRHLGSGGFAHTYCARVLDADLIDEFQTDVVALKIPLNKKKGIQLKKEITLNGALYLHLKQLLGKNLVRCLGFESFRSQVVMVMEHVSGGNLRDRIGGVGRQKPLPLGEALDVVKGILAGLQVIHDARVFHRDIKPENILMDGAIPKIADLGISRMLDSNELASTTTGTIYYMSPEILGDEGASFPADIWSVGVTFYEMLTGRLPFGGANTPIGTTVDLIRTKMPTPPSDLDKSIPRPINDIVLKALCKEPGGRFCSAAEMLAALENLKDTKTTQVESKLASIRELLQSNEKLSVVEARMRDLVRQYPEEGEVYQLLGEFLNRCERFDDAIQTFKKGLRHVAENPMLRWDLALAYQKIGNPQAAVSNLEKALSLGLDPSLQRHARMLLKALRGS